MTSQIVKTLLLLMTISTMAIAQPQKAMDRKAIKGMCGCYEVRFNFSETFNYADAPDYRPSPEKHSGGLEWVQLVTDENDKVVLQHLLVAGEGKEEFVIKHWRQDWLYENTEFYMFDHGKKWKYVSRDKREVKGQWTQKVYQVDDSPRYEGSATWVHVDGKSYWENTTDSPLPRREFTQRSDYNVMVRRNRHQITPDGWVHEQDNDKVIREAGAPDRLLAQEKGYNTYRKVDDSRCQTAIDWWKENAGLWAQVRAEWDAVFAQRQDLQLKPKVDNKLLYQHLFGMDTQAPKAEIRQVIRQFVGQ